jgi:hypothetical protein
VLEKVVCPSSIFWYMYCGYSLLQGGPHSNLSKPYPHARMQPAKARKVARCLVMGRMFAIIAGFPENLIASFGGHPKNAPSARMSDMAFMAS